MAERREQWDGVNPRRAWDEASIAARKRALLLLWRHCTSLRAELRHHGRVKSRYEDLFLITLLARLERDWLTQPLPASGEHNGPITGDDQRFELGVAEWAQPWGVPFLANLQADLYHLDQEVKSLGKWLPPRPRMAAEHRARERLQRITAKLEEGALVSGAEEAAGGEGAAQKARGSAGPSATRAAAIAAALVAAAGALAGLLLLASNSNNGARHPVSGPRGTEAHRPPSLPAVNAHAWRGPRTQGAGHEARGAENRPTETGRPSTPATTQLPAQSVAVSANVSTPAPAPTPAVGPAPSPSPEPVTSPNPAPSQDQTSPSEGGGGCPPEFGFEC